MQQLVGSRKAAKLGDFVQLAAQFDNFAFSSFALRRIFWKSPCNVKSLAECAQVFAREIGLGEKTSSDLNNWQNAWQKQIFEQRIEGLALTLHLLATFFSETEILKTRTIILEEQRNNVVGLLINIVTDAVAYTCGRLFADRKRDFNLIPITATETLFEDLLTASTALIYEIILSAQAVSFTLFH